MRKLYLLTCSILVFTFFASANPSPATQRLADYIKVWGFLKYYHPSIASGKADADSVFIYYLDKVIASSDNKTYRDILESMLQQLSIDHNPQQKGTTILFTKNDNTGWINSDKLLSQSVRKQLAQLRHEGFAGKVNRYMPEMFYSSDIPAEHADDDITYPNVPYQLLALARYWNAIEYLFPYKYMIGKPWDDILNEQVPAFAQSMSVADFEKHLLQLNAAINDSHGGIMQIKKGAVVFGSFFPPFTFKYAGDSIVVTDYVDTASCKIQDIQIGDVILLVRGKTVPQIVQEYDWAVSASNINKKKYLMSSVRLLLPFRGADSLINITFVREKKVTRKQLIMEHTSPSYVATLTQLYIRETGNGSTTNNDFVLRSITNDIAWIDAANLSILYNSANDANAVDSVLLLMRQHKKALLIDMRCYATQAVFYNKLLPALGWKLKPFADYKEHSLRYPGNYYPHDIFSPVNQPPLMSAYTAKVILLVDEITHSQSELITMILQASGNAITVGVQSSGADGDMLYMPIPGGYMTSFTGRYVAYPDGVSSQRSGVKRNIKVKYTTKGVATKSDEILEAALQLVK